MKQPIADYICPYCTVTLEWTLVGDTYTLWCFGCDKVWGTMTRIDPCQSEESGEPDVHSRV